MSHGNGRRILNEEQYENSANWLISAAIKLSDPLLPAEEKATLMKKYDFVASRIQSFNRGRLVLLFPGLRDVYKELGWEYDDLEWVDEKERLAVAKGEQPHPKTEPMSSENQPAPMKQPDPEPETEPDPPKVSLSSWLDDDD